MIYKYNKLWKLLSDKNITKNSLMKKAGISSNVLTKMKKDKPVSKEILETIAVITNSQIDDMIEIINTNENIISEPYSISHATIRNWKKLNANVDEKLASRANKSKSKKRILPIEYFSNIENFAIIQELLNMIDKEKIDISSAVLSLSVNLLMKAGIYEKDHVITTLKEYQNIPIVQQIVDKKIPTDENDFIGLFYQSYLYEGKKNTIGSYYTPSNIAYNMTKDFDFSTGKTFLDPCCGSGAFLLAVPATNPEQLFGIDNDKIAVLIAKVNLLLKFSSKTFIPQIYCLDFLTKSSNKRNTVLSKKFDYIATNPPWGATANQYHDIQEITSKETFSYFFVRAFEHLKNHGKIRFLFPEAILNVKVHKDIRKYILDMTGLISITIYPNLFSGVATKYIDMECDTNNNRSSFLFCTEDTIKKIDIATIYETENLVFNLLDDRDTTIIHIVKNKGKFSLKESTWALGIVTGDNKRKLFHVQEDGMEPIYTGKEIEPYVLKPVRNYLFYNKAQLQQVAKDEIYRAQEKLVYKFIAHKLTFAYDDNQMLFLNSANILIPKIPHMHPKTVMAFLNSQLFQFMYIKLFGEVKILKGNLCELPFPEITKKQDEILIQLVNEILKGDTSKKEEIDNYIFSLYPLSNSQIQYIRSVVNGKINR